MANVPTSITRPPMTMVNRAPILAISMPMMGVGSPWNRTKIVKPTPSIVASIWISPDLNIMGFTIWLAASTKLLEQK